MNIFTLICILGIGVALIFMKFRLGAVASGLYLLFMIMFPSYVKVFGFSPITLITCFLAMYVLYDYFIAKNNMSMGDGDILKIFGIFALFFFLIIPFSGKMHFLKQIPAIRQFVMELLVPACIVILLKDKDSGKRIQLFILCVTFITCLYGFYTYMIGSNLYSILVQITFPEAADFDQYMEEERAGLDGRIGGFVGHPVFYSGMLMLLFYFIAHLSLGFLKEKKKLLFSFSFVVLLCIVLNIFLSGTRSAMVALFLGIAYYAIKVLSIARIALISGLIACFVAFMAFVPVFGKYQPMIDSIIFFWDDDVASGEIKGSSVTMRLNQLEGTVEIITGPQILFGNGAGWVRSYMEKNGKHPVLLGFESLLFSGLVQYGILGFVLLYGSLFGLMIYVNRKLIKEPKNKYIVNGYILSYLVYALLTGAFCFTLYLSIYVILLKTMVLTEREAVMKKLFLSLFIKEKKLILNV